MTTRRTRPTRPTRPIAGLALSLALAASVVGSTTTPTDAAPPQAAGTAGTARRVRTAQAVDPPDRSISWLSLGDSYGAGEGATRATGYCQRSVNAAGPKAAAILKNERGWTIGPTAFAACTGYLAADAFNSRNELQSASLAIFEDSPVPGTAPRGAEISNDDSLYEWARAQGAPHDGFDVIVASLSGNDIGFADIVVGCTDIIRRLGNGANSVLPNVTASPWEAFVRSVAVPRLVDRLDAPGCGDVIGDELDHRIDNLFAGGAFPSPTGSPMGGRRGSLDTVYRKLADSLLADDGVFVVMGYPRLIVPSSDWGRWRGDQCNMISGDDADALGRAAERYDDALREHVEALGDRFAYVSRLEIFDDGGDHHSLCGRTVEWLNTPLLFLRDGTLRKQRGFHPNDLGYLATAEQVAGIVEARLGTTPPPPTTSEPTAPATTATPPTVRSSESHYEVGEPFSARCTVAWPTAPSRGVDSIQMRTSCADVPDQFLFVDIVYDDPDLPVTPSHATMQVEGEIADIVRSEYGYTTLVVYATDIDVL